MSVKRQLSLGTDFDVNMKNFRTTLNNQKLLITCFENLSNEIYYEIFDYLDGCCIYKAFSNLNIRFEQLITSSSFFLKIFLCDEEFQLDEKHSCRDVIIPNKHRIISLHLSHSRLTEEFCIDSSFIRLESIYFYEFSPSTLISILPYLKSLPRLFTMSIHLHGDSNTDLGQIYQMIFHLPTLKYNFLSLDEEEEAEDELNILVPFVIKERSNTIESLIIKHGCTLGGLISILCYAPKLKYLSCRDLFESDDNNEYQVQIALPQLTHVIIQYCHVEFVEFEKFLKKICSQLKTLHIRQFLNRNYTDPDWWKQLILQNMPQLRRITVKCFIEINDSFQDVYFNGFVHQFTSQFWIERGWNFSLRIIPEEVFYLIHSDRQILFSIDENMAINTYSTHNTCHDLTQHTVSCTGQKIDNASLHVSLSNELFIVNHNLTKWRSSFIDTLSSILRAVQFTSLYITCSAMAVSTLLKIICWLPNLNSLSVSFSISHQLKNLSDEDEENLRLLSKNNKITKVCQVMDMKITEFLIALCPRIEHFEVTSVMNIDLQRLVRLILIKTITHIPHLHSICFSIWHPKDEIVHNLQNIIDSEKLLHNYTIKRSVNKIYLQWK